MVIINHPILNDSSLIAVDNDIRSLNIVNNNSLLNLYFWNCHGFDSVENSYTANDLILSDKTILCINETWKPESWNPPSFLNDFHVITSPAKRDHVNGRNKGGLAIILSKKYFNYTLIEITDFAIFIAIDFFETHFIVINIYFNPKENIFPKLDKIRTTLSSIAIDFENYPIFIGGDFNARVGHLNNIFEGLNPDSDIYSERFSTDPVTDTRGVSLVEFMEGEFFILLNGRTPADCPANPTYFRSSSTLDLVWCNLKGTDLVKNLTVPQKFCFSDHFRVIVDLSANNDTNLSTPAQNLLPVKKKLKWNNNLQSQYRSALLSLNLDITLSTDINQLNNFLVSQIWNTASNLDMIFDPQKKKKRKNDNVWFDSECRAKLKNTRNLFRRCKRAGFPAELTKNYNIMNNEYKMFLKHKKTSYNDSIIHNLTKSISDTKNPSDFWSVVKKFNQKPFQANPIPTQTWSSYLLDLFATPDFAPPKIILDQADPILDCEISMEELNTILDKCKNNKALGVDGVSYEFYKNLPNNLRSLLLNLFNEILSQEKVPDSWGEITTFMIHKKRR